MGFEELMIELKNKTEWIKVRNDIFHSIYDIYNIEDKEEINEEDNIYKAYFKNMYI